MDGPDHTPVEAAAAAASNGVVDLDERRLLPRHIDGDEAAFGELIGAYRAPVYSYLVRCGLDPAQRDDLFQEVFLKVHAAARAYQPSRPLKPWLFTIVANTVRSHFRKVKVRQIVHDEADPDPGADPAPDPEAAAELSEQLGWLERAIGELPLAQREVVILTCIEEMTQKDASIALQIPINTIKTHLRRARLKLARDLAARDGGEA